MSAHDILNETKIIMSTINFFTKKNITNIIKKFKKN